MARELLTPSGSVFVQISDENLHHVRESMDEVFGAENFCAQIVFRKTTGKGSQLVDTTYDVLLWYAKVKSRVKFQSLFEERTIQSDDNLRFVELTDGIRRRMTTDEATGQQPLPPGARAYRPNPLTSARPPKGNDLKEFEYEGKTFRPGNRTFSTDHNGLTRLAAANRLIAIGNTLTYARYLDDFPHKPINDIWDNTRLSGFGDAKLYVVQTSPRVLERCILMTTDPGDLVLDPTCGSGTTAYVAEQWGRRWITIDTSRVPLALARQRLLTATYDYYELKDPKRGPAGGFVYKRKQNKKGEEVGGIVPHVTLKSIANDEPPEEEVLVDRPEIDKRYVRVSGPFWVEATIPTPVDWDGDGVEDSSPEAAQEYGSFVERMIEVLRRSPVLHVGGGKTVTVANVRPPANSLSLSAEAVVVGDTGAEAPALRTGASTSHAPAPDSTRSHPPAPVAFVFGPENGAVSEKLVNAALTEARMKGYAHLYVVGFAIQPHARTLIESADAMGLVPATYVQATPDLMMGDLLKNMRSSQIFSVCGLPEIEVHRATPASKDGPPRWQVELIGLDTFDPTTMKTDERKGNDVPAWFLDQDYNDLSFHVSQAFFPRTGAWNDLRKALKGDYDDGVWDHLAGTMSAPFEAGEHAQVAVKVIDDRGNELMVVRKLTGDH